MDNKKELLKQIPKIDEVLKDQRLSLFFENTARELVVDAVREIMEDIREGILKLQENETLFMDRDDIVERIVARINRKRQKSLRPVINATGTILHTNLGRAKLSEEACRRVTEVSANYSTLEFNLHDGSRGSRHEHIEKLIRKITGAEAAMAVNNNAAAVFLCLSALAAGKDVIVSRGELVEIGGSFRIPEIMEQSGARLVEVGTTNKTRIDDYRKALAEGETGALLKVHTSNYKIMGFTSEASLPELAELGKEAGIPVIYDLGSGLMVNLQQFGVDEPTVLSSLKTGIDVIMFSGDKLLGGPQAGIIAGKKEYIERMKKHPLARVLRLDKMSLAALEATFREYLDLEKAKTTVPVLSMITVTPEEMRRRAELLASKIEKKTQGFYVKVVETETQIGGGSTPNLYLPDYAVAIKGKNVTLDRIERDLRKYEVPVIVRIKNDQILIDMRTVSEAELETIAEALTSMGGLSDA
ncbi:MAG TPA: L-seryl-tRNA(Sec) selenium transferase [Anaerovoracaceae bacterium]|nr:L-seryl-tRNA(Sec) selenium transferase [Anaerovoracaceae bacterium]